MPFPHFLNFKLKYYSGAPPVFLYHPNARCLSSSSITVIFYYCNQKLLPLFEHTISNIFLSSNTALELSVSIYFKFRRFLNYKFYKPLKFSHFTIAVFLWTFTIIIILLTNCRKRSIHSAIVNHFQNLGHSVI